MIRNVLSRLRALLSALRPRRPQTATCPPVHIAIASHTRRYPGRSSALDLRLSQGWITGETGRQHQDRRA